MEEEPEFDEKKMFGGICFLMAGNMACGIINDDIIVRVRVDHYEESLKSPFARPFDMTGRPMKGWVMISSEGLESDDDLAKWIQKGIGYARSLPPK